MSNLALPTLAAAKLLQTQVSETKARLQDSRIEAVTGRVADVAKELNGDIAKVQRIEKLINETAAYEQTISYAQSEFSMAQLVLGNSIEGATALAVATEAAVDGEDDVSMAARSNEAEAKLQVVFSQLNASVGGRYLFSGAAVDTPPLASVDDLITDVSAIIAAAPDSATAITDLDTYFETPGAGFDAAIYQGSTTAAPAREVAPGRRVGLDFTAVDQSVKDVIRGLVTIALADAEPEAMRDALMADGADALARGETTVISAQNLIGGREEELQLLATTTAAQRFTYETTFNALTARDEFEAASLMANLETQLEASYLAAARISQLSLVYYL